MSNLWIKSTRWKTTAVFISFLPLNAFRCIQEQIPGPHERASVPAQHLTCLGSRSWKLPRALAVSARSRSGFLEGWDGFMSRSLVYLGVRAAPCLSYTAIQWVSEKTFSYLSPFGCHIGLSVWKFQPPWLHNRMMLQVFRRAYSKGLGCFFLKFCIAPFGVFWVKSFLNALMLALSV